MTAADSRAVSRIGASPCTRSAVMGSACAGLWAISSRSDASSASSSCIRRSAELARSCASWTVCSAVFSRSLACSSSRSIDAVRSNALPTARSRWASISWTCWALKPNNRRRSTTVGTMSSPVEITEPCRVSIQREESTFNHIPPDQGVMRTIVRWSGSGGGRRQRRPDTSRSPRRTSCARSLRRPPARHGGCARP